MLGSNARNVHTGEVLPCLMARGVAAITSGATEGTPRSLRAHPSRRTSYTHTHTHTHTHVTDYNGGVRMGGGSEWVGLTYLVSSLAIVSTLYYRGMPHTVLWRIRQCEMCSVIQEADMYVYVHKIGIPYSCWPKWRQGLQNAANKAVVHTAYTGRTSRCYMLLFGKVTLGASTHRIHRRTPVLLSHCPERSHRTPSGGSK